MIAEDKNAAFAGAIHKESHDHDMCTVFPTSESSIMMPETLQCKIRIATSFTNVS